MNDEPKTLVELRRVAKSYSGVEVLHDVDLILRDGEFMTVLGPSGSGKTTVLRLIGGLVRPTQRRGAARRRRHLGDADQPPAVQHRLPGLRAVSRT